MTEVYFEDPTFEVFDDVAPALSQIAAERVVSVVTNGDVDPASIGLDEWVSHTVNAPRVGVAKPDGRIFEHALGGRRQRRRGGACRRLAAVRHRRMREPLPGWRRF